MWTFWSSYILPNLHQNASNCAFPCHGKDRPAWVCTPIFFQPVCDGDEIHRHASFASNCISGLSAETHRTNSYGPERAMHVFPLTGVTFTLHSCSLRSGGAQALGSIQLELPNQFFGLANNGLTLDSSRGPAHDSIQDWPCHPWVLVQAPRSQ